MARKNLPVLTEEATNRKNPKLPARYFEVSRAILQGFQFSVWIAVKKEFQENVTFFSPRSFTAQKKKKKKLNQLYARLHPLLFSSVAKNTFALIEDQPEQSHGQLLTLCLV